MAETTNKELQATEKRELATPAEQTRPGLVFSPAVDIYETDEGLNLLADMPGVVAEDLQIDLRDNTLTLTATVGGKAGEGEEEVWTEYGSGGYFRQFSLSDHIDQAKIDASITDGVLHLTLPKVEAVKPRQIRIKTG